MRFQNKSLWTSVFVGTIIAAGAVAGPVTLPHSFQPHTPARAAEVNANFAAVKTAVDDNDQRITTVSAAQTSQQGTITTMQGSVSTVQSSLTTLTSRVTALESDTCVGNGPNDVMVRVGTLCVDKYEASIWSAPGGTGTAYGITGDDYPASFPDNGAWSTKLYAASVQASVPSSYVTWFQAAQACAAAGKRLPTSAEWQTFAGGAVPDTRTACNLGNTTKTAPSASCVNGWGVVNTTGNVAEYASDWVHGNKTTWNPGDINTLGVNYGHNWVTGLNLSNEMNSELFPNVLVRGGDFGHYRGTSATIVGAGSSAGPWRVMAQIPPSHSSVYFGFRCVK